MTGCTCWYALLLSHSNLVSSNPLNPGGYEHLISPYISTAETFTKIMRICEIIITLRSFDCKTNSSDQYEANCIEKIVENVNTDVRVQKANRDLIVTWCYQHKQHRNVNKCSIYSLSSSG